MPAFHPTPFTVPAHGVIHRPGDQLERTLDFPAPEQLGDGIAVVREGTPIHIDVRLEGLHDGVLVSAEIDTEAHAECVRCLDPLTLPVQVEFQELFAYSVDEAFDFVVQDDHVNLEPVVRDAVVLSLPFQPVCRPDCPGLDPLTGEKLADDPDRKPVEVSDPRWAALESWTDTTTPDASGAERVAREKR